MADEKTLKKLLAAEQLLLSKYENAKGKIEESTRLRMISLTKQSIKRIENDLKK